MKTVKLEDAVGLRLAHDITEIRPGEFKGRAFAMGHEVREVDLCRLRRLGKNNLYVLELAADEVHENEAAAILAAALAGEGVECEGPPREGRINLLAGRDGLLTVDVAALAAFNMTGDVMCATLHDRSMVGRGERVAATRAIPLAVKREAVKRAAATAAGGVVAVRPLRRARAGLIVTGDEIHRGLIEDRFLPVLSAKVEALGSRVAATLIVPDDAAAIARAIRDHLSAGCDLLLLGGGMSVDPDDVTRHGIRLAGADDLHYGAAALPGAMFLVASLGDTPLLGVPACALFHRATVLDLILPRILAGERPGAADLALLGHGGLCRGCDPCRFPICPFGRG